MPTKDDFCESGNRGSEAMNVFRFLFAYDSSAFSPGQGILCHL
jgi:hypothetical protein